MEARERACVDHTWDQLVFDDFLLAHKRTQRLRLRDVSCTTNYKRFLERGLQDDTSDAEVDLLLQQAIGYAGVIGTQMAWEVGRINDEVRFCHCTILCD